MTAAKAKRPRHQETETPRPDWTVALLGAAGLVVAGYLAFTKWSESTALFCAAGGGCDVVQASRYAVFLGLPTALWGAGLYALIAGLTVSGLSPRRWLAAFLLAVAGVSFSAYLTYLSFFVLGATCGYCLASAAVAAGLFVVLLWRRPAVAGRRSPVRPARVAALGIATAVLTVVVGAGVFAWESPREVAARAEPLARHLSASGAVFYGAYW